MAGVRRCFVSVGLAPNSSGNYVKYESHARGKSNAKLFRGVLVTKTSLEGIALLEDFAFDEAFGQDDNDYLCASNTGMTHAASDSASGSGSATATVSVVLDQQGVSDETATEVLGLGPAAEGV